MGSLEQEARHWHCRRKEPTGSPQKIPSPQPVPCSMGAGGRTASSGKHPASFCPAHPFLCGAGAASCSQPYTILHLLFPTSLSHFSGSHQCSLSSSSLFGPWLCSQVDLSHLTSFITPKLSNLLYWDLPKQLDATALSDINPEGPPASCPSQATCSSSMLVCPG